MVVVDSEFLVKRRVGIRAGEPKISHLFSGGAVEGHIGVDVDVVRKGGKLNLQLFFFVNL